jgi:UDP-N-acetylmuramoyl-L-alanyl-D-glutamate--2,6-diaminopimelate ligase
MAVPTPRRLGTLLAGLEGLQVHGDADVEVSGLTHDSRLIEPGMLFVAYRGVFQDVHRYIPDAINRGAVAVLGERPWPDVQAEYEVSPTCTYVRAPSARFARSHIADALYGHPSRNLIVLGVTGTDGKTTTSSLLHAIVEAAGTQAGLVTTVGARTGGEEFDTGLHTTTPEPEELHAYLADMRDAGVEVAVVEVTSHGLDQHRVSHVSFDIAVITNITHEALEYHGTFEAYSSTKARLFHMLCVQPGEQGVNQEDRDEPEILDATQREEVEEPFSGTHKAGLHGGVVPKTAVLNAGDRSFDRLSRIRVERQLTYALATPADFTAEDIEHDTSGLSFTAVTPLGRVRMRSPLLGHYNVANILAAAAAAHALDIPPRAWQEGVAAMKGIPGRMEIIDEGQPFMAVVDFAHTPNALRHALDTARELLRPAGRVIAVFGCAGLRDASKRRSMGRIAGEKADLTFITAEDPRTERLSEIMSTMAEGLTEVGARKGREFALVADRYEAIRAACQAALPLDVVIVLGKGHEHSMCFGTTEYPWDDRDALRAALRGDVSYGDLPTAPPGKGASPTKS